MLLNKASHVSSLDAWVWLLLTQSDNELVCVWLVDALHVGIKAVVQRTSLVSYTGLIFFPSATHKSSRSSVPKTNVQSRYCSRKWEEALISQDGVVGRLHSLGNKVGGSFLNPDFFKGRSEGMRTHPNMLAARKYLGFTCRRHGPGNPTRGDHSGGEDGLSLSRIFALILSTEDREELLQFGGEVGWEGLQTDWNVYEGL